MKLSPEQLEARRAKRAAIKADRERERAEFMARAEQEAREAAEREQRKWLPRTLRIVNRGLIDVLLWLDHPRARNWLAVVNVDPTAPGGLSRAFFGRGRGPSRYVVPESLAAGMILEFAADYVTYAGRKVPDRRYAVVTGLTAEAMTIHPYPTFEAAFQHQMVRIG